MDLYANVFGEGQPLIILHGFLGMGDNWKTLGRKFSEQGFEVHLVDQRNHGRSFHDATFTYEVLAQDLYKYCEKKELDSMTLIGHSMGGKTAMMLTSTYPDLVSKLIVADIAPRFYPRHHDAILDGLSSLNFDQIKSRSEADRQLSLFVSEFGTRQFLLKNLYWIDKERLALRVNLEVLKENIDEVGEALPAHMRFEGSTLFLKGDRSEYISVTDEDLIRKQFPNALIQTVTNAGHWLHAENPVEFFEKTMNFLKS